MLAVKLAGPRRMIGMRMIPANDFQAMLARGFLGIAHILRVTAKRLRGESSRRLTSGNSSNTSRRETPSGTQYFSRSQNPGPEARRNTRAEMSPSVAANTFRQS